MGSSVWAALSKRIYLVAAIFCIFHPESSQTCTDTAPSTFVRHPEDLTVREGENATFTCTVSNFNTTTHHLKWYINSSLYYSSIISYLFDESSNQKTSSLSIFGVGRHQQSQKCKLYVLVPGRMRRTCESRNAVLRVQYFPREEELNCGPRVIGVRHENDLIHIWCNVTKGNPTINLSWHVDDSELTLLPSRHQRTQLILEQDIALNLTLHDKQITCSVTSDAFPARQLTCTIGEFIILHRPRLAVFPEEIYFDVDLHKNVRMICTSDAYPPVTSYSWTCSLPGLISDCHSQTNAALDLTVSINSSYEYNDESTGYVTCFASNSEGTSNSSSKLRISRWRHDISALEVTLDVYGVNRSKTDESTLDLLFICSVNDTGYDPDEITIYWNFASMMIKYDDGDLLTASLFSRGIFYLMVKSLGLSDLGKEVACLVETDHRRIRKSMRISFEHLGKLRYLSAGQIFQPTKSSPGWEQAFANYNHVSMFTPDLLTIVAGENGRRTSTIGTKPYPKNDRHNNVVLITVAAVVAGITLTATMFACVIFIMYKHFKRDDKRNTSTTQDQTKSGALYTCMKPLGDAAYSTPPCTMAVEDEPIYEEPMSSVFHQAPIHNEYECPNTNYESNIFSINVDSSDVSESSGADSPSGSVASAESFGDGQHQEDSTVCRQEEKRKLGVVYGNISVFDTNQTDTKDVFSPRLHKSKFILPTGTSFPDPPPLPKMFVK